MTEDGFRRAAAPVDRFLAEVGRAERMEPNPLASAAGRALDLATEAMRAGGARAADVAAARYGLAYRIDRTVRATGRVSLEDWRTAKARAFGARPVDAVGLRDLISKAAAAGPDFAPIGGFLAECLGGVDTSSGPKNTGNGSKWIRVAAVAGFAIAVAAVCGVIEWRHQASYAPAIEAAEARFEQAPRGGSALVTALDQLEADMVDIRVGAATSPLGWAAWLPVPDAGDRAMARLDAARVATLPSRLSQAVAARLAEEGDPARLYDSLRAEAILSGDGDWDARYLAGWAEDLRSGDPSLPALARHISALPPIPPIANEDVETLATARRIASDGDAAGRAFVELKRAARGLPNWNAETKIPDLSRNVILRSGAALDGGVAGLFTADGWHHASNGGAQAAIAAARRGSKTLLGLEDGPQPTTQAVLDLLQTETIAVWRGFLADLRVRPFETVAEARQVTGALGRADSVLSALLQAVWAEAGGLDRRRSHNQQLKVAAAFGPMERFLAEGRLREISRLFAALNVSLADVTPEGGSLDGLMSVEARAQSVATLATTPPVIASLVLDTLSETARALDGGAGGSGLQRSWTATMLPRCQSIVQGFPFAASMTARDVDSETVRAFFGPNGRLAAFQTRRLEPFLDRSTQPWSWKPEARLLGLDPASAAFLERAAQVRRGLFPGGETRLTFAALGATADAVARLGGDGGEVPPDGADLVLSWPGEEPGAGMLVGVGATRFEAAGYWGLHRVLRAARLRWRQEGAAVLVDFRGSGARLLAEMTFPAALNPVSVVEGMKDLTCPDRL